MSTPCIGIFLPSMSRAGEVPGDVVAAARQAEDLGFESVWVIDQLVAGTQMDFFDSTMVLSAAAAVTERVKLGFGVLVLPLHPVVWVAKQIAALQHLSGDRVILGVGVGEDRHPGSWGAAGIPRRERGRLTDAALRALPDLISGRMSQGPDGSEFRLGPGATVPPIVVGGISEAALARAAGADGWFGVPLPPVEMARLRGRLAELAAARGRATPTITGLVMAAVTGDPGVTDRGAVVQAVADPAGMWGFPYEAAEAMVVSGPPAAIAEHLAALGEAGVQRVAVTPAAGTWSRQAELLAEAARMLG
jgi:alkanesulfonate monooxygenase SsuD/methylene tetrahydromethanopterin reductase-like flavin-dependent oxidoreductase (luciferase family)